MNIAVKLLEMIKKKGIFSEYLPDSFNINSEHFNIYGAGASYKDAIEPYSYNMSRMNNTGERRIISIPELAGFVSFVNYLYDNSEILNDIIKMSHDDINSFSRILNEEYEVVDNDDRYGMESFALLQEVNEDATVQEDEKEYSLFVKNMLHKISASAGAVGVLHIDISGFYRNIYTHTFTTIRIGAEEAKRAFAENSDSNDYLMYVKLDERIRAMNGKRTNGLLVGPYISRVLSETILARVDIEFRNAGLNFVRYADDYEFYIYNEKNLDKTKSLIDSIISKYYFEINNEKTFYEKYPFYVFENFEKIIKGLVGSNESFDSVDIIELFNKFFKLEKDGNKGALRYLLSTYKNEYHVEDKDIYASYLLNVLCNDERAIGLASKIIISEYKSERIEIDEEFKRKIIQKLNIEIERQHDLEVIWLTYLFRYIDGDMTKDIMNALLRTENDLVKIILLNEWGSEFTNEMKDMCWQSAKSWILLYEMALQESDRREEFYIRAKIDKNRSFYEKLFNSNFNFYKKM